MSEFKNPSDLIVGDFYQMAPAAASWAFEAWKVDDLRSLSNGSGIIAAVLDTGIDGAHQEFIGKIVSTRDFTNSRSGSADKQGHGTHCAGTVAGNNPTIGVATGAKLVIGKVLGDSGSGGDTGIAAGVDWAVEQGAEVISMSLGSSGESPTIRAAIKRAADKGVWVVAAAGNEGKAGVGYPGGYPECISVAAIDKAFKVAPFSSRGAKLDISGPGVDIVSARPGGGYQTMSGTSMATPFVAGLLCCLRSAMKAAGVPIPNVAELRKMLAFRAADLGQPGDDNDYGPGWMIPLLAKMAATPDPQPVLGGEG